MALHLLRARPAQGRAAGAARRGLHHRLALGEFVLGRGAGPAQRQPGPRVGRHARRRADRLRTRRPHLLPLPGEERRHDLRPQGGPRGQHLGRHQGAGPLPARTARRRLRGEALLPLAGRCLVAQQRPGLFGRGGRPRPHLGGDLRRWHRRAGRPRQRPLHPRRQRPAPLSPGGGGPRALAPLRRARADAGRDGRRTPDLRSRRRLRADALPLGAEDSGRHRIAGQQRHHPHIQGLARPRVAGYLRRRTQPHRGLRGRRHAAFPLLRPRRRTPQQHLHGRHRGPAGRPVGLDAQRRVALRSRARGAAGHLPPLRRDAERHSERGDGPHGSRWRRPLRRRAAYLPLRSFPHPLVGGRLQPPLHGHPRGQQARRYRGARAFGRRRVRSPLGRAALRLHQLPRGVRGTRLRRAARRGLHVQVGGLRPRLEPLRGRQPGVLLQRPAGRLHLARQGFHRQRRHGGRGHPDGYIDTPPPLGYPGGRKRFTPSGPSSSRSWSTAFSAPRSACAAPRASSRT